MYGVLGLFAQGCHILDSLYVTAMAPVGHGESWQLLQKALTGCPWQNP